MQQCQVMPRGIKKNEAGEMEIVKADAIGDRADIEDHAVHILIDEIQVKERRVLASFSLQSVMELVVAMLVIVQVKHQVGYRELTSVATLKWAPYYPGYSLCSLNSNMISIA